MWRRWSLRAKIVVVTLGVSLPVVAASTALVVRMSRRALEQDVANFGLTLAREAPATASTCPRSTSNLGPRNFHPLLGVACIV